MLSNGWMKIAEELAKTDCNNFTFNSAVNLFLTEANLDCARTPITSAYRSAIMCILTPFGLVCNL